MRRPEFELDSVFAALAHETRRRILNLLRDHPGVGVGEIAAEFEVSRIAVMKHLQALEDAQLIVSEKDGRKRRLYFNSAPIRKIYDLWTDEYSTRWTREAPRVKNIAEIKFNAEQFTGNKRHKR
ncbi:MAG: winged helix-turn-helix transcriptional regulator [Parvularculaceae bacterium]|nr:winged helix-turn-helix transcriptional regulator [Parvularculaceae bacterium]